MKSLSLPVMLAAVLATSTVHGSEAEPATPDPTPPLIAALHSPATMTASGRDFIAHCNDEAFATARFPQKLADRCERLLRLWHRESSSAWKPTASAKQYVPDYANALRYSQMFYKPPPMGSR